MDDNSIKDDLLKAIEEHDVAEDVTDETTDTEEVVENTEGVENEAVKNTEEVEDKAAEPETSEPVKDEPTDEKETSTSTPEVKAPAGWKANEREHWKDLPASVRDRISAREREIETALNDSAHFRKDGEELAKIAAPYQALMAAEGAKTPLDAVKGLFDTVATLRMGSAEQKAATMANLINVYGIDINALDNALVGNTTSQDPIKQAVNEAIAPYQQHFEAQKNHQIQMQQQHEQRLNREIDDFASRSEFYKDVAPMMADFLDVAARNGQRMTLDEAYQRACASTPEVMQVLEDRKRQERNAQVAKKTNAAATLSNGSPTGETHSHSNDSIRGSLLNALEEHGVG